ncbi:type VII secretion protein EccB [Gordonia defluvii]|jgi:type VII secretion protein EccB|uniref:Type VII secretion protein EccB n=1 Tax=Gordonia defluvii TaxID=283718 RepID=A0ABP6LJK9_9ACTN|nr:type VII secretion protein EccB [Gordonia sp. UBA5067]
MVRQLTTRAQVSGYRFLLQRAEHALVRRDARMLHDPMRLQRQSIMVGLVVAILVAAGAGVYGLIRPVGSVADAPIVLNRSDGGLYVVVDHTAHPVLNLASARLIAQTPAVPKEVSAAALRDLPRGPTLGIIGAPNALGGGSSATWRVCDVATADGDAPGRTAVIIGDDGGAAESGAGDHGGLFAVVDGRQYLVYRLGTGSEARTVRARVDAGDAPVRRALRLEGAVPRQLSAGLVNAIEEVAPLAIPVIPAAGRPGALGLPVGAVFAVRALDGRAEHYVALADGVQPVSAVAAEILRLAGDPSSTSVPTVSPARAAAVPIVAALATAHFPARIPRLLTVADAPVICQRWYRPAGAPAATVVLLGGHRIPGGRPIVPVGADGSGPAVDEIVIAPGTTYDVRVTGIDPRSPRRHSRFIVGDTGIRYSVADDVTATTLGLGEPGLAPWPILGLLPAGPDLSRARALVAHGGFEQ